MAAVGGLFGLIVFLAIGYGLIKLVDSARGIGGSNVPSNLPNPTREAFLHGYNSWQAKEARRQYREYQAGR